MLYSNSDALWMFKVLYAIDTLRTSWSVLQLCTEYWACIMLYSNDALCTIWVLYFIGSWGHQWVLCTSTSISYLNKWRACSFMVAIWELSSPMSLVRLSFHSRLVKFAIWEINSTKVYQSKMTNKDCMVCSCVHGTINTRMLSLVLFRVLHEHSLISNCALIITLKVLYVVLMEYNEVILYCSLMYNCAVIVQWLNLVWLVLYG